MPVALKGGCRVTTMREGVPERSGSVTMWRQVDRSAGAQAISLRVIEFAHGLAPGLRADDCDEVLYVLEASREETTISIEGWRYSLEPETGIYVRPGETYTVENRGAEPVVLLSSQCPEPRNSFLPVSSSTAPNLSVEQPVRSVRLRDRRAVTTSDRWYRVLVDEELGSTQVTQFVGSIPPGRAPDHFHEYEEVLFVLRGTGTMWAGDSNAPIGPGACIYLPRRQVHCVENTGDVELRLLGIFYPAGSPSVSYQAPKK